jgi:hypothetical protein
MPSVWNEQETRDIKRVVMKKKRSLQRSLHNRVKRTKRNAKVWGKKQSKQIQKQLQKGGGGVGNLTREQRRKPLNTVPTNFQYYQ